MKKAILAIFALATAFAISPVASAQNYDFTYEGSGFTAAGWLTIAGAPSASGNYATAGDLNWGGTTFSLVPNPAVGPQLLGSAGYFTYLGGTYTFEYDDLFFPNGPQGAYLDVYGLLFANAAGTEFINIWSNGAGTHDSFWAVEDGQLVKQDSGNGSTGGSFAPYATVPEYSGLSMLILSALTLAGGFFFKSRQSGLFLAD